MRTFHIDFLVKIGLLSHDHSHFEGLRVYHLDQKSSRLSVHLPVRVSILSKAVVELVEFVRVKTVTQLACYPQVYESAILVMKLRIDLRVALLLIVPLNQFRKHSGVFVAELLSSGQPLQGAEQIIMYVVSGLGTEPVV